MKKKKLLFSVIIPALNEEHYIAGCIQSVQNQDFVQPFEIIIVDNKSTDQTAIISKKMGARVIHEPRRGLPMARECGRRAAHGAILVYLDADMIIPRNYLTETARVFKKNPTAIATSNPFTFYDGTWTMNIGIRFFFRMMVPCCRLIFRWFKIPRFIFGGNFAVRSTALDKIGGFNTAIKFYGEDADLSKRLGKLGPIVYIRKLHAKTSARRYLREGIIRTNINYIGNYFSVLWCNRPLPTHSTATRRGLLFGFLLLLMAGVVTYMSSYPTAELAGQVVYKLPTTEHMVALTFDDGPNGTATEQILTILSQKKVPATFFVIGKNVEQYPELIRRILREGHQLGNHSYDHPWRLPFEKRRHIWDEIIRTEAAIEKITGEKPLRFRPPHGLRSPWMIKELHDAGYTIYTWDDMTDDYVITVPPEKIIQHIIKHIRPGAIIVLHDGLNMDHTSSRENTIAALPVIIDTLRQQGYRFVPLAQ